ncbi:MAG TPA: adenylate kinase [Candidatus Limnocylindria bacterium]
MRRVSVIGNTGSGKSTVARALAERLRVPYVELDALHWGPGWTEATGEQLVARVAPIVAQDAWVIDGMYYRKLGGLVPRRADTIVWIDPPFVPMFLRLLGRSLTRIVMRTTLYNGNRESFRATFMSRDSILLFALRTRPRRRALLAEYLSRPEFAHARIVRFASTDAALRWAASVRRD